MTAPCKLYTFKPWNVKSNNLVKVWNSKYITAQRVTVSWPASTTRKGRKQPPVVYPGGRKGGLPMYTDYGYIGSDGIEYATLDEAIEAGAA